ncbi:hypothetical protein Mal64_14000 [Pseudobythopirellula maris]|uniref:Uncharacterized protein n=1 Tax=Pseudobythopirellula maris TaxID=2527991 RepID=A0A5C5ZVM8_9BACT|nr:hypothetical protein [Pseudobythopirellula maris]TWT91001.1 hypothetical protein Mal64_14000 [Pseudobythopirellula maris]
MNQATNEQKTLPEPAVLQEYVDSRGVQLRTDAGAGVLRGVKLLGLESKNGRRYREKALREAISLYEGAKVNVNHPQGDPLSPRDYRDRLGVIRGVELRPGEGLFGALHYNPKHALSEQLAWDAEHSPENVGLSHNVVARTAWEAGALVVESIQRVQSVDLVADPATTRGLFEHAGSDASPAAREPRAWSALTLEQIEANRPDLVEAIESRDRDRAAPDRERLRTLEEAETQRQKRDRIDGLLEEHGLPRMGSADPASRTIVSQAFADTLLAADDAALVRLIEDRRAIVAEASRSDRQALVRSQEQPLYPGEAAADTGTAAKSFLEAITR